jgi:hypothetical protein
MYCGNCQFVCDEPAVAPKPREFCKYRVIVLLELCWKAIHVYLRGEPQSVGEHEWAGAIAGYISKKLSTLLVSDFRQVACICTKFSLLLSIVDKRLDHATEDHGLQAVDDTKEGFRWHRSTKRQLGKLQLVQYPC